MSQIFADIKTPFVNELTLKRNLSPKVKENIFQGIIMRPNEGCTEKFSTDTDAAEIQVIRIKPDDKQAREIGADVNGKYFNGDDAVQPNSEAYGIKILTTIDHNIDIPTNAQDMVNVDLAEAELQNLSGKVNRNINAITIAAQLCKNFNDIANGEIKESNWITLPATYTKGDYKNALLDANAKLDEGNEAQGIDLYPSDQRVMIIRSSVRSALMREGELIIGGSNYAQGMLADGGLSPNAKRHDVNGFAGYIDGVPVYVASPVIFNLAAKYLGIDTKVMDGVIALVVSAIGTGRALAFNSEMKTIPCPVGQGIRLQPKYRMGAACWDGLSVVPVVVNGFTNPATKSTNLKVLAPGSRTDSLAAKATTEVATTSKTTAKATKATE